jgi:hypothetical protein
VQLETERSPLENGTHEICIIKYTQYVTWSLDLMTPKGGMTGIYCKNAHYVMIKHYF